MSRTQNTEKRWLAGVSKRELGGEARKTQMVMVLAEASDSLRNVERVAGSNEEQQCACLRPQCAAAALVGGQQRQEEGQQGRKPGVKLGERKFNTSLF